MSLKKLQSLGLILLIFAAASCKKEDETTVLPSLSGSLSFKVPAYVHPGAELTMTPKGVEHPENEGLGYYWKVTPTMTKNDTTRFVNGLDKNGNPSDGTFKFVIPDTLQTYTVTGYAFAEGYSYTSRTSECTAVTGGINGSITNTGITENSPSVTVNGTKYYYTTIGGTDWLSRNVSDASAGAPYFNSIAMDDVFGRYYTYEEALTVCPEGWTLPGEADWTAMAEALGSTVETAYSPIKGIAAKIMGNAYFNDALMWEYWPEVGDITNESGFSAIPTGFCMLGVKNATPEITEFYDYSYPQANFKGVYEYATFWTADAVEDEEGMAYYRYIICNQPDIMIGKGDAKSFGASVRCVRSAK